MNELELIDALVKRLERLFYGHPFMNRKRDACELHDVKIFPQYIPQAEGITLENHKTNAIENYDDDDVSGNFPCVIVRFSDGVNNEERSIIMSQMTVKLIVCVYDESARNEGYRDVLNMITMMRDDFFVNRFIDQRFRILMPVKNRLIESDSWPVTYGELELKVETGRKAELKEYIYERRMDDGRGIFEGRLHEIRRGA